MDDLNYYDLIEYWDLTIKKKMIDGCFQSVLHQATIKWFNNTYFEGMIIQQQNNVSCKVLFGYAFHGPYAGTISFNVVSDDGSVRNFQGDVIDEWSIFGYDISKDENEHDDAKARWSAFRYKKISQEEEEVAEVDDDALICPYCNANLSDDECGGECNHIVTCADEYLELEYPVMPDEFEWSESALVEIFADLRSVLEAYEDGLCEKPRMTVYFEKLMENITCNYETEYYSYDQGGPASSYSGKYYFAEDPDEVHKQLKKIIRRLECGFNKLANEMNKAYNPNTYPQIISKGSIMKKTNSLIKQMTPEEIELEKKRAELSVLEDDLALKELDLTTLQVALEAFRRRYLLIVGVKLAQLDDIEAQIAEIIARLDPKNKDARKEADRSRTQAQESANTTGSIAEEEYATKPFKPSEELKQLYRELAKKVHPDLAPDEQSRERRHRFMQEVNQAYAEGNEERLRSLLNEWESSPDSVSGEGTGAELIRIIRQIARVHNRIEVISQEIENLQESELYKLKIRVDETQDEGRDLLLEMAAEVDGQIEDANTRLKSINQRMEKAERSRDRKG